MNDALSRLIAKTRPMIQFTVDLGNGESETLQVRRTSVADNERISRAFDEAYHARMEAMEDDSTIDYAALRRGLMRSKVEELASYIAAASRSDIETDVRDLYDGQEETDELEKEIQDQIDAQVADMTEELKKQSKESLMITALDKREHFAAMFDGYKARLRMMAMVTIHDQNGNALFPDMEAVTSIDESTLEKIIDAAAAAIREKEGTEPSPLK